MKERGSNTRCFIYLDNYASGSIDINSMIIGECEEYIYIHTRTSNQREISGLGLVCMYIDKGEQVTFVTTITGVEWQERAKKQQRTRHTQACNMIF